MWATVSWLRKIMKRGQTYYGHRQSKVHMVYVTEPTGRTACGVKIPDHANHGFDSGQVTCKRCMPHYRAL
jgi:hypothetical protein